MLLNLPFTLSSLRDAYGEGISPTDVIAEAFRRLEAINDPGILIHADRDLALWQARSLGRPDGRPLWGIPYVVKDNIDVSGMPTTAACPDFSYQAKTDAFVVAKLRGAGAICLGKANLDQFATGLVGVRTPYPVPKNALDPALVPGGSSSGSAVAVAHGIAAFALGTDTAGSGRVPAALNSVVGLKPTLGALSSTGLVPACRSLDTVSIFAHTVGDAYQVFSLACGHDPADAFSRTILVQPLSPPPPTVRIGIPDTGSLDTGGNPVQKAAFRAAVERLANTGAEIIAVDFRPFFAVADMLYEGAWLAERVAAVGDRLTERPDTLHPTTRAILEPGLRLTAVDAFRGLYRLKELARPCRAILDQIDALLVPTVPDYPSLEAVLADPFGPNTRLGTYTNFVNLLDLCGVAVPVGTRADGPPASVTVLATAGRDALAAALASGLENGPMGATDWTRPQPSLPNGLQGAGEVAIAVCGAHMSGLPLNHQLTSRGGRFLSATRSAPVYTLHALAGGPPFRPGMLRVTDGGAAIDLEVWAVPEGTVGSFLDGIPEPLGLGTVTLEDGRKVKGFLCEASGLVGAVDITAYGGWRNWLASLAA